MSNLKAKTVRLIFAIILFIAGAFVFHGSALAQQGDRKDSDRGERNDREERDDRLDRELRREKYRRNFNLKDYLTKLDDNKNGVLDKGEVESERTRRYLSDQGIDVQKSVPIELAVRQAQSTAAKKREADREKFEGKVGPKLNSFGAEATSLGVASFGAVESESAEVASFDDRLSGLKQSDFDEETLADARKLLNGYDRDESGFLEGDEVGRIRWKDPSPTESDLNGDGRISLLELAQRTANKNERLRKEVYKQQDNSAGDPEGDSRKRDRDDRGRDRGDGGRGEGLGSRGDRRGGSKTPQATPAATTSKTTSSRNENSSRASASREKAFANYVENVFKKYDTDKDQRLSPDELKKMKRPFRGDSNGDGFLSKAEAIEHVKGGQKSDKNAKSSTDKAAPAKVVAVQAGVPRDRSNRRGSTRQSTVGDRSSLGDKDANADGQIQMSEFSSTWDEKTLQKFREADSNGDGILSVSEWNERTD